MRGRGIMTAESARRFEALEAQAQRLLGVFTRAGYEHVAPAIIQPASHFLDVIGEDLRARTYVFTDPEGEELCLRPDLTVPTCRLHLERHGDALTPARYCYNGPAFRFQQRGAPPAHPNEFRQAGLENFAAADREAAEAETLGLMLEALRAAGVEDVRIRIGDLGLFHALLDALELPARWRRRLRHTFGRPEAFRAELKRLVTDPAAIARGFPADLLAALDPSKPADAEDVVEAHLASTGREVVGTRTLAELTESLLGVVADSRTPALVSDKARVIESYFAIAGPADECDGAARRVGCQRADGGGTGGVCATARFDDGTGCRSAADGFFRRVRAQLCLLHGLHVRVCRAQHERCEPVGWRRTL